MKIAITGGAGFIATELARALKAQGHELVLIDLRTSREFPEESCIADITRKNAVLHAFEGVEVIYHLAAEHRDDVRPIQKYYDVNVKGTQNVISAAEALNIKTIIFSSSVAIYGLDAGDSRETDTPSPFNDYGTSKLEAEKVLEKWVQGDAARTLTTIRLVATFGAGNRGNIYTLINQIAQGKFFMVGNGRNKKSIAYVGNVAAFFAQALRFGKGQNLYNYADKPDLDTTTLVTTIRRAMKLDGVGPRIPYLVGISGGMVFDVAAKITGRTFPISVIRVKKFCADTTVNADKMQATGFKPPHTLAEGLQVMITREFTDAKKAA